MRINLPKIMPAPWTPDPEGEIATTIEAGDGMAFCDIYTPRSLEDATVAAISAVPALLRALSGLLRAWEVWRESGYRGELAFEVQAARAALLAAGCEIEQ